MLVLYASISQTIISDWSAPGCRLLVTRVPLPPEPPSNADREIVVDPHTGIAFAVTVYPQFRRETLEISALWGVQSLVWAGYGVGFAAT
jgi:hypothetical protein